MAGIPPTMSYPMPTAAELPGNVAHWWPEPGRAVLLVHDMQRYFLNQLPAGRPPRSDLVPNVIRLRQFAAESGMPVAYTAQPGRMTDEQRGLLKDFWGPGMRAGPEDREIITELSPGKGDWLLTKWRYSAFFRSELHARMQEAGRDQLVICGLYAHVGVLMTAADAFTHDIETFVVADAIADFSREYHRLATEYAAQRCAVVRTTDQVLAQLGASPAGGTGVAPEHVA